MHHGLAGDHARVDAGLQAEPVESHGKALTDRAVVFEGGIGRVFQLVVVIVQVYIVIGDGGADVIIDRADLVILVLVPEIELQEEIGHDAVKLILQHGVREVIRRIDKLEKASFAVDAARHLVSAELESQIISLLRITGVRDGEIVDLRGGRLPVRDIDALVRIDRVGEIEGDGRLVPDDLTAHLHGGGCRRLKGRDDLRSEGEKTPVVKAGGRLGFFGGSGDILLGHHIGVERVYVDERERIDVAVRLFKIHIVFAAGIRESAGRQQRKQQQQRQQQRGQSLAEHEYPSRHNNHSLFQL